MAVAPSRGRAGQMQIQRKLKERDSTTSSPERTKVWSTSQPTQNTHNGNKLKALSSFNHNNNNNNNAEKTVSVPVVYYLSRNGQLEHPHFIEVPLSSPDGLFLRDVINRLNLLRGKGMAYQYAWSSKRSYKSGYVWHDLEENDFIHPVHGGEYVLKGSEINETSAVKSPDTNSSSNSKNSSGDSEMTVPVRSLRRRNQSWGSAIDLHEYKVYKAESTRELGGKAAADASTQTDDKRRQRGRVVDSKVSRSDGIQENVDEELSTELSREEISPPPSDSSPETLESLMKADGRLILASTSSSLTQVVNQDDQSSEGVNRAAGYCPSGKIRPTSVIMSLLSCGSMSFRDCGAATVKDHGFSLVSQYKNRLPRGGDRTVVDEGSDVMREMENEASSRFAKMALEDKEYFSGSLIETSTNNKRKEELSYGATAAALKRSSSYNADRSSHLKLAEKEVDGVRAKCIPRRPKMQSSSKKETPQAKITQVPIPSAQDGSK